MATVFSSAMGTGHTDNRSETSSKPAAGRVTRSCPDAATKAARLDPWQPVDSAFNGCSEGFCGARGQNSRAVVQPRAKAGDYTYCLVSGAVFQIKDSHSRADV